MTGIVAFFSEGPASQMQVDRMMTGIAERARDAGGTWVKDRFALGAAILHTTAESFEAELPWTNADESLALVMDGYLTNWEELRSDLIACGAQLRNRSDAELVLRAYEQWGEDCPSRIEGEFAFVIADRRSGRIFAARDHQGLRPLYVYEDKNAVLFASEIRSILAVCRQRPEPNFDYLANIASGHWFLRDATVWQGIGRVPQAHWVLHDGRRLRQRRYYEPPTEATLRYRREQDYADHYRHVLFDAVRRTSRSHRPLAAAVSGGLDSSSIYCIAHELEQQGRLSAPGLQGYSLVSEPSSPAFELPFAQAVVAHCGRFLTEVPLFSPGVDWFTERGHQDCDVPIPQNGAMTIDLERRAASNGARAMLNGDGGDQWLDGTREYYAEFAKDFDIPGLASALVRDARAASLPGVLPGAIRMAASAFAPATLRRNARRRRRERQYRDQAALFWMLPEWRERLLEIEDRYYADQPFEPRALGIWNRLFSPYRSFALDLMQRQRAVSGMETREPMQTRQFIEFCATTPKWIYNQAGVTKVVHRKAMRGIMPDIVVDRRTKAEFSDPPLTREFARFAARRSADGLLDQLCDRSGVQCLTGADDDGLSIDPDRGWEVWGLYAVATFLASKS